MKYLEVVAGVRYYEDAYVNGEEDINGDLIPCKNGDMWCPIIEFETGKIINWEVGKTADIHYKVCDQGEYFLLDENKQRVKKEKNYYVPDVLCPKDKGFGDYIVMDILEDGTIKDFKNNLDLEDWEDIT